MGMAGVHAVVRAVAAATRGRINRAAKQSVQQLTRQAAGISSASPGLAGLGPRQPGGQRCHLWVLLVGAGLRAAARCRGSCCCCERGMRRVVGNEALARGIAEAGRLGCFGEYIVGGWEQPGQRTAGWVWSSHC